MAEPKRVLVVGHQRSGTTWVGAVLGATGSAQHISEPDDASRVPFAMRALARRGMLPLLRSGDAGWPDLIRVFDVAFGVERVRTTRGRHRVSLGLHDSVSVAARDRAMIVDARVPVRLRVAGAIAVPKHAKYANPDYLPHSVVKSAHGSCMVEWVAARWKPAVVVCVRHPLEVVASFLDIGLVRGSGRELLGRMAPATRAYGRDECGVPEPTGDSPVPYVAWQVGLVMSWLDDARRAHPEFHVFDHEDACEEPAGRFHALVDAIGLEWTADTEAYIRASDQPGTGYQTHRVASEQRGRWRTRLSPDDVRAASRVLIQFPIAARYEADLAG